MKPQIGDIYIGGPEGNIILRIIAVTGTSFNCIWARINESHNIGNWRNGDISEYSLDKLLVSELYGKAETGIEKIITIEQWAV